MDMQKGPNVDIVANDCYRWSEIPSNSFDVIISGQAFEHMEFFWLVMEEVSRVLAPGGLCCIIVPSQGAEHKFPVDCYRFYPDGMVAMAKYVGFEILHVSSGMHVKDSVNDIFGDLDHEWKDSILIGRKPMHYQIQNTKGDSKLLEIIEMQKEVIHSYETATCWKMTKPIRMFLDYIKRIV